ncbi:reverse transcriptase domain-containing protein, partial [Tanacetum coccineum]
TVGRTGKGSGRTRGQTGDQGSGGIEEQGGQVGGHGNEGDVRNIIVNNDQRGCSYKEFLACNPKEYDEKGGAIVFTYWIEKIESVQDARFVLVFVEAAKHLGGSPVGIHGLFSGRYCGLANKMVTLRVSTAEAKRVTTGTLAGCDNNHNSGTGARRNERATRECTYPDFMKCQPLNFKGTEGVVELTQWIEKMETVFRISNCSVENQIKFSTCTLLGNALTWWNSHVRTVGNDIAYAMTWTELKKKITDKYYPRTEIKKLEVELWELKVKGTDVIGYNQRFQELALLCGRMFPEESDKIEKYVGGLPDMIHGSVVASKPKTMQEATEMAIEVMDKRIRTFADRGDLKAHLDMANPKHKLVT